MPASDCCVSVVHDDTTAARRLTSSRSRIRLRKSCRRFICCASWTCRDAYNTTPRSQYGTHTHTVHMIGEPLSFCGATDPGGGGGGGGARRRARSGRLDHSHKPTPRRRASHPHSTGPPRTASRSGRPARGLGTRPREHTREPRDATRLALDRRWTIRASLRPKKQNARARPLEGRASPSIIWTIRACVTRYRWCAARSTRSSFAPGTCSHNREDAACEERGPASPPGRE